MLASMLIKPIFWQSDYRQERKKSYHAMYVVATRISQIAFVNVAFYAISSATNFFFLEIVLHVLVIFFKKIPILIQRVATMLVQSGP